MRASTLALVLSATTLVVLALLLHAPVQDVLARPAAAGYDVERMVLLYATLPRLAMAVLCGAGLAASGAILQQVLRNPLASPTTLGIEAGARLALTLATLLAPALLGLGRDLVALAGSAASTLLVFALVRGRGSTALAIVLAGLVVAMYCGALATLLTLLRDRVLNSLFIWGSGSLVQQGWDAGLALTARLALTAVPALLLLRPLALLDLADDSARALGLSVPQLRLGAIAIAAALAAFVTSATGVIGFVGLVAPLLARACGVRGFGARLGWSVVFGALLLLLTDATVQLLAGDAAAFVPTGAVTAVLGAPLLLVLLPRLRPTAAPADAGLGTAAGHAPAPARRRAGLALAGLALLGLLAAAVGRTPDGSWILPSPALWPVLAEWRLPRVAAAAAAGALLGVAGFVLQRLTGNAMASPEVLGVGAGAVLGVGAALFLPGALAGLGQGVAAGLGAVGVLAALLAIGQRTRFAPQRVLLAGVALNALIDAIVGVLAATGDPRAMRLLGWMAGSTGAITAGEALQIAAAAVLLLPLAALTHRWLTLLPLGAVPARALGVPLARARLTLLLLAALMTAAATPVLGPLSFVGLMAPHIVLSLGIRQSLPALAAAALAGAAVVATADGLARTIADPIELPTGLVSALVGTPFLMLLLARRRPVSSLQPEGCPA
ncbi:MAG: Fe(3+)-hydroxamate ABC transporter permease FhuB [Burkholderiales bacterium]|nr:Fe(3+)-hydroxamate ABC transporter permease FhuB [Burkholderiales bacterium]